MKKDILSVYLETGKVPSESIAQDAGLVASEESPMKELLISISATAMVAKDLHYKAKGKPFLANHELADMIADIEKHKDTINEVYYMGELQSNPPLSIDICGRAVEIVKGLYGTSSISPDENMLIGVLHSLCMQDIEKVEKVKESGVKSGTQSAIDEISKDSMQYAGFLKNVLSGMGTDIDADSEESEVVDTSIETEPVVTEETVAIEPKDVDGEAETSEETDIPESDNSTSAQKYMELVNSNVEPEQEPDAE